MNLRKTHLWISLIVGVIVWGCYFWHVIRTLHDGRAGHLGLWFVGALVVIFLVEGVATGLIAWLFRQRSRALDDGPTLQAALKASHIALMILIVLILVAAALVSIPALFGWTTPGLSAQAPVIAANGLLGMVVVAELSRAAFTLLLLPRR